MRTITANLPTLGNIAVHYYDESFDVLQFVGANAELNRLKSIPHLGVAASAFLDIQHSRLEYLLLQCGFIEIISRMHLGNEALALSGKVSLNGLPDKISSCEELLKCWAILGNYGHAQYTYGTERTFLQFARQNADFKSWIMNSISFDDLKIWAHRIIDNYDDNLIHYLLAILRVEYFSQDEESRERHLQYLRNYLLNPTDLFSQLTFDRSKLNRLQSLFTLIQKISFVTLDSYYSHHPFRLQGSSAVLGLTELSSNLGLKSTFEELLDHIAGWLADEIYLHPKATALQRYYERRSARTIRRMFKKYLVSSYDPKTFLSRLFT